MTESPPGHETIHIRTDRPNDPLILGALAALEAEGCTVEKTDMTAALPGHISLAEQFDITGPEGIVAGVMARLAGSSVTKSSQKPVVPSSENSGSAMPEDPDAYSHGNL